MGEPVIVTLKLEHSILNEALIHCQLDNPTTQVLPAEVKVELDEVEEKPLLNSSEEISIDIKTEAALIAEAVADAGLDKTTPQILITQTDVKDEIQEMPAEVANCTKPEPDNQDRETTPKDNSNAGLAKEFLFECRDCGKRFKEQKVLSIHERVHTFNLAKPFRCKYCGKDLSNSNNLLLHIRRHTGEKPYECSICKKAFVDLYHCQVHMRTHTGEKPYKCKLCHTKFAQVSNLTSHMKTHSTERPFRCDICQKGFLRSGNLVQHSRTHEVPKEEKKKKKQQNNNDKKKKKKNCNNDNDKKKKKNCNNDNDKKKKKNCNNDNNKDKKSSKHSQLWNMVQRNRKKTKLK